MATDTCDFTSSDSVRSAVPLKYVQYVTFQEPLALQQGGCLPSVRVAYETYGTLSPAADNAVLICHALSGDSHVARHDEDDSPGWWDLVVGPGKAIDTERYFVICPNLLGGCRGTTGPNSVNPETGKPYGADFPIITVRDMVEVQRLLVEHLGIRRLRAVVGGSLGGQLALTWATQLPGLVAGTIALATSSRLTSQAMAFDVVGRNAILHDPAYQDGQYYGSGQGPSVGLSIARMLGHITYLSREAMIEKFDAAPPAAAAGADRVRDPLLGRLVPGLSGRQVRRAVRCQQLPEADNGHRPVRSGRRPRRASPVAGNVAMPLVADEFHDGLALSAVPVGKDGQRPDRRGQAGKLLQREEQLRARRLPAGRRVADLRRDDAGVSGEFGRRRGDCPDFRRPPGHPRRVARRRKWDCPLSVLRNAGRRGAGRPKLPGPDEHFPSPPLGLRLDRRADSARRERAGPRLRQRRVAGPAARRGCRADHRHRTGRERR